MLVGLAQGNVAEGVLVGEEGADGGLAVVDNSVHEAEFRRPWSNIVNPNMDADF